jgi:hypothetical protein
VLMTNSVLMMDQSRNGSNKAEQTKMQSCVLASKFPSSPTTYQVVCEAELLEELRFDLDNPKLPAALTGSHW